MLITTTAIDAVAGSGTGPVTIAFAAGTIRRIRMVGLQPTVSTAAGVRTITVSNVRVDSGGTVTIPFSSGPNSAGIQYNFTPNDGLDLATDQPSTITFLSATASTYTCFVGYDRVT